MNDNFSISVIIPVYNSKRFIEKAIMSVLQQPEVTEIVAVNDGSTDDSLQILEKLHSTDNRIKIYHHKNRVNKGRSASRNLGIQKATGNFIAFLDADDYFLPNRFTNDKQLFQVNKKINGIYNAIGAYFYREATILEQKRFKLTTVKESIKSEDLFETLLSGKKGYFSIDGLTIKKSVFDKVGFFNEALVVAEDTEMFWKMALKCQLVTGIIDQPLAMRGVHYANVFNREDLYQEYYLKMYESLIAWCSRNKVSQIKIDLLLKSVWHLKYKENNPLLKDCHYWSELFVPNPKILFSVLSIKYFPVIRLRQKLFPFLYS